MKKVILYTVLMFLGAQIARTQKLEHFNIDTTSYAWYISPNFESGPKSGVNKFVGDYTYHINKLVKEAVKTLPEEIRQMLIKYKVKATVYFNSKGEIFYLKFCIFKKDKFPTDDKQWLKVYHTFRHLKIDLSKLRLLDNFEWGAGFYPLGRFLESENSNKEEMKKI